MADDSRRFDMTITVILVFWPPFGLRFLFLTKCLPKTRKCRRNGNFCPLNRKSTDYQGFFELLSRPVNDGKRIFLRFASNNSKSVGLITRVGSSPTTGTMSSGDNGFELSPLDFFLPSEKEQSAERKRIEADLQKATSRSEQLVSLYEKLYEDNLSGKVTDEWFAQLSQKYDRERLDLKAKAAEYRIRLNELELQKSSTKLFTAAIRKFMEMQTLTAPMLRELIDHIDVFEKEGSSKHYTQRIMIYYRFGAYIEIPTEPDYENYTADTRQGVKVEYIPTEMFPTQHGKSA